MLEDYFPFESKPPGIQVTFVQFRVAIFAVKKGGPKVREQKLGHTSQSIA